MYTLYLALGMAFAADAAEDEKKDSWDVTEPHGPTHTVSIDVDEGTWMDVAVRNGTVVFDLLGDLWTVPLTGGEATRLTEGAAWEGQAAFSPDGTKIAFVSDRGGNENLWLMNADGTDPKPITKEEVARVTHPVWDSSGQWVVGRRRTVDTRSIGVTELWQWHIDGGKGIALTSKDEHPHAGEHTLNDRHIWFSSRSGRFNYNEDPVSGLWRIERLDRKTGAIHPVVHGAFSPDGKSLVFISRDRTKTLLEAVDLATGKRRVIGDWLSPDNLEAFALHGTYPRMDWTDGGDLVLWAQGKLWRVDITTGVRLEIPFHVSGDWRLHDVIRPNIDVEDELEAKVIRWPTRSARDAVAFSALGQLHVRSADGTTTRIGSGTGFAPAWSRNGEDLLYTSWSEAEGGKLHLVPGRGKPEVLPVRGQLVNPAFGPDGKRVLVLRGGGGASSPDLGAEPWYEIVLLERGKKGWTSKVVTTVHNRGATQRAPKLHLHEDRIWWMDDRWDEPRTPATAWLVSVNLDGTDKRDHLKLGGAEEAAIAPDFSHVAYKVGHQLHVARFPKVPKSVDLTAEQVPSRQVTKVVGDWIGFTADSQSVTWAMGNQFKTLALDALFVEKKEAEDEPEDAPKPDPFADPEGTEVLKLVLPYDRAVPDTLIALTHARVLTMKGDEVLEDTTVVIRGDRIASVGGEVPAGAKVIDCTGKTVIPGLIDVHAHLHFSSADIVPEQEWRYLTALDFGVTTVQDPSASTDLVFTQAEMVEAGLMKGPRVFSTGAVLYGALSNDGAETPTLDAAHGHLKRLSAVGARSVKVYQQSQRTRRQWYLKACADAQMLCVPEGGGDLWMNLGMIADGFHAIEHSLPMAPIYDDVREFWAGSPTENTLGTAYTQTLLVAYGGLSGENWFIQHRSPLNNERLLRHFPKRQLDAYAWRPTVTAQDGDWRHMQVARDAAELQKDGVLVSLGAHGQLQGLGVHWELWAMAGEGAMTPHQALRAATLGGAQYMGLAHELGTVAEGMLADLIVLDENPLDAIENTAAIHVVLKNGELFD